MVRKEGGRAALAAWSRPVRALVRTKGDPRALAVLGRSMRGAVYPLAPSAEHVQAAMDWLSAAQDATGCGGVSAFYDLARAAWAPAYPETTGYIIPTFFDYAARRADSRYRDRALRMADWLLGLQLPEGGFPIGPLWAHWPRVPLVFDTGQIIHGLVRTFEETGQEVYLDAARRAGDWLGRVQSDDGSWRRCDYRDVVHTYNARVAWALVRLSEVTSEEKYRDWGQRNLLWCAAQQQPDGWFDHASFLPGEEPLTHTIAYTIRGLLEGGVLLHADRLVSAARQAADQLRDRQAREGYLRGAYGPGWRSRVSWSCLTGDVQMAQIWLRLFELTGERSYLAAGVAANAYVRQRQVRETGWVGVDGGIAGSYPIQGAYQSFQVVNWAAKFFVDSLLLEDALRRQTDVRDHSGADAPAVEVVVE